MIQWCNINKEKHPGLGMIFAIPNGGKRSARTGAVLKLEGVKPGVPDLFLPVSRKEFHGLFIEMKRLKGGSLSPSQKTWKKNLECLGYRVEVAKGFEAARDVIIDYLGGDFDE